jgi:hypothetical protein
MKPPPSLDDEYDMHLQSTDFRRQLEMSMSKRAVNGELYHCSITMCFHMFHYVCLLEWF